MSDDIPDPLAERQKPRTFKVVGGNSGLKFRPARMPEPETIPPRRWLYGTQLLRGYVSVLVAPGGVGKTGYAMGVGVSLAAERSLFGEHIHERCNVALLNLEDELDELERRLAALMIRHSVDRAALAGRLFLYSADDGPVTIAKMGETDEGFGVVYPDVEAIIAQIQENDIGLLIVDPFAESHDLEENSNPQMIRAMAAWRRIARGTRCAIFLIHHVRKGAGSDIEAARGAKAQTDSARVGLLMSVMSEKEAEEFEIEPKERTAFVRLDDAKANMARRSGVAHWFKLESVPLGNMTADYPSGDRVAALVSWVPPSAFGDLTVLQCNEALDRIELGPRTGVRYAPTRRGRDASRWGGEVLIELFGLTDERAAAILAVWLKNHVLTEGEYQDAEQRKPRHGLFVNETNRPGG